MPETTDSPRLRPSGTPPFWRPGEQVWWRYRRPRWSPGDPETVHPVTVVRDDAEALVAWIAPGTPVAVPRRPDGRGLREAPLEEMFTARRVQAFGTWFGRGNIRYAPTGRPWSVWLFWEDDGSFSGWYVNLEDPHVRDARNVYSTDHVLDVEVEPDGRITMKDEHELVAAVDQGRFTPTEAERYHADAQAAVAEAAAGRPPYDEDWAGFRPDPAWPVPALPPELQPPS
jgi:hypothetical protein